MALMNFTTPVFFFLGFKTIEREEEGRHKKGGIQRSFENSILGCKLKKKLRPMKKKMMMMIVLKRRKDVDFPRKKRTL